MSHNIKILIIGYGNPGRQDDGVGVLLVDDLHQWAEESKLEFIYTDSNYQLNLEDAATISDFDLVIFADASKEDVRDFIMTRLEPSPVANFTMHSASPAFILHICEQIFHRSPEAYLLHIKGYKWEFMNEPTARALENLNRALEYVKEYIINYSKTVLK
ncbi:MAG: hydrogenase maturation protease [Bacteroidales bacterium]|nr:hydrogenase maturation protease [Bacteroidales bacterium]